MENTLLIAVSRQATLRREMDVIAHNLANMNTQGYKGQRMMFVDHLVRSRGGDGGMSENLAFVRDVATRRIVSDGPMQRTGNPLDLAIDGDGYFVLETDVGERYTRDGRFQISLDGTLVNEEGVPVLAEGGQPIVFSPADTDISVAADGTISTENGELGRLRVVRFENQQELEPVAGGMVAGGTPEDMEDPKVVQGMLEGSNVEALSEMARMMRVHRAYDSVRRMIDTENDRMKKMVDEYAR